MPVLTCRECGQEADRFERGWKAWVVWEDEGPDDELVILCPDCCIREELAQGGREP
jgi:hypothetical protein